MVTQYAQKSLQFIYPQVVDNQSHICFVDISVYLFSRLVCLTLLNPSASLTMHQLNNNDNSTVHVAVF